MTGNWKELAKAEGDQRRLVAEANNLHARTAELLARSDSLGKAPREAPSVDRVDKLNTADRLEFERFTRIAREMTSYETDPVVDSPRPDIDGLTDAGAPDLETAIHAWLAEQNLGAKSEARALANWIRDGSR